MATRSLARGLSLALASVLAAQGNWSNVAPPTGPSARSFATMTFDLARFEVVMFGGATRFPLAYFGDTWVWSNNNWSQRSPATVPPARQNHGMVFDIVLGKVLMFGGLNGSASPYLGDTWTWDGTDWTQLTPANSPSPRSGVAMAYDLGRARAVLYGGSTGAPLGDTWEWDGTNWLQRSPSTQPSNLGWHMMSYDLGRGVSVMFGGYTGGVSGASDETYEWDGTDWVQRFPAVSPPGRYAACFTYDQVQNVHVLFGGWDNSAQTINDTWEWDGTDWAQRFPATTPSPRAYLGHAFDIQSGTTMIFAGEHDISTYNAETWLYENPNPASFTAYGTPCAGGLGNLALVATSGPPWIGDPIAVELRNLAAGSLPFLVLGFQRSQVALGQFGIPGCTQWVAPLGNVLLVASGGVASWSTTLPNSVALAGVKFQLQGAAFLTGGSNPYGAAVSAGLEATIGVH